jgi:hypothetical protein
VCQLPSSNAARRRKGIGPATLDVLRPDVSFTQQCLSDGCLAAEWNPLRGKSIPGVSRSLAGGGKSMDADGRTPAFLIMSDDAQTANALVTHITKRNFVA